MSLKSQCTDEQMRVQEFGGGDHQGHIANYPQSCGRDLSHQTLKSVIFAAKINTFKSVLSKMHYNVGDKAFYFSTHLKCQCPRKALAIIWAGVGQETDSFHISRTSFPYTNDSTQPKNML